MEAATARQCRHLIEGHEGAPQHDGVAEFVDAATTSPAGELGVFTGCEELVVVAGELAELLDHHGLGRHVDTHGEGLGGENHLHQALDEARLDHLLERGNHAGMVGGHACFELGEELAVAEDGQVRRIDCAEAGVDDLADTFAVGAGGQSRASRYQPPRCLVALVAAEDEEDRRQHSLSFEKIDHFQPRRGEQTPTGLLAALAITPGAEGGFLVESGRLGVRAGVHEGGQEVETVVGLVADEEEVVEPHRSAVLDDGAGGATNGADPISELGRIAHSRRQAHEAHVWGEVDDHFLPHGPAVGVLQEVHLVEHDHRQVAQSGAVAVDHVAQHFGGHHHHVGVGIDRVVAGEQTNPVRAQPCHEVVILLVGQGFDRRGVERPLAPCDDGVDGVLGHHGLSTARRRCNQHGLTPVECVECV